MHSQSTPIESTSSRIRTHSLIQDLAPALVPAMLVLLLMLAAVLFTVSGSGLRLLAALIGQVGR